MEPKSTAETDELQILIERSLSEANTDDHILMYRIARYNLAAAAERVRDILLNLGTSKLVTLCTDEYYGKSCRIGEASERKMREQQQLKAATDRIPE